MGKGQQPVTGKLRKLAEDLDAISVSDRGAWKKLAAKVQRAAKAKVAKPPGVQELLELTVQGLMQPWGRRCAPRSRCAAAARPSKPRCG